MNYRHIYHAGNFADVLKHTVLALIIEHLKQKETPFRVVDTHAGIGLYDLASIEAEKTGEWHHGIGRIFGSELPAEVSPLLGPYLDVVKHFNPDGQLRRYPGSPLIARRLMRNDDRLAVNELHPDDHAVLASEFARDRQTKVLSIDAWSALKALLPPKERRGVVLVDPPFEEPGELTRMVNGLIEAHARFATGTYLLWFPIKDLHAISGFERDLRETGLKKLIVTRLQIRSAYDANALSGTGLAILNPSFQLDTKLSILLHFLSEKLAQGPGNGWTMDWLSKE